MARHLLVLGLLTALSVATAGERPAVSVAVSPVEATVGDFVDYTVSVALPPGWSLLPSHPPTNLGVFEVHDTRALVPDPSPDGTTIRRFRFRLAAYRPGEHDIPPPSWLLATTEGRTLALSAVTLRVAVKEVSSTNDPPPPPKPVIDLRRPFPLGMVVGLAVLVGLGMLLLSRRRDRNLPAVPESSGEPVTAEEEAQRALDRLLAAGLPSTAEAVKDFYDQAADVVRSYVGRVTAVATMERTTDEIVGDLRTRNLSGDLVEALAEFLRTADLVKFAKHHPGPSEVAEVVPAARRLVDAFGRCAVRTEERP